MGMMWHCNPEHTPQKTALEQMTFAFTQQRAILSLTIVWQSGKNTAHKGALIKAPMIIASFIAILPLARSNSALL